VLGLRAWRAPQLDAEADQAAKLDSSIAREILSPRVKNYIGEDFRVFGEDTRMTDLRLVDDATPDHRTMSAVCAGGLTLTSASASAASAIFSIEPQFLVENVLEGEPGTFALASQIGLHFLALLKLMQGLD
jgi:hypothetical protein